MATIQTVTTAKGEKRYQVRWWEGPGHQRKRTFSRFEEARRYKTQIERQRDMGEYLDPSLGKITLGEWCLEYIESEPLEASTKALYSQLARLYLWVAGPLRGPNVRVGTPGVPMLARRPMNQIRKADIEDVLRAMRQAEVGTRTIQATHSLMRRLFSSAVERERIARNPVVGIRVEKAQPRERRYLVADEVALVAKLVPDRDRALVLLLAYLGLRIGEASFLRVKHVDVFRRQIAIVGAAKEVQGRRLEGPTKTGSKRSVHLPAFLVDELVRYRASFSDAADPEAYFFRAPEGGPLRAANWRKRVFQPACLRAGVKPAPRTHDLRHTAASLSIAAGAHPKEIQEMLGHSSITMTLDLYGHLFPQLHERTSEQLDEIYRGSRAEEVGG